MLRRRGEELSQMLYGITSNDVGVTRGEMQYLLAERRGLPEFGWQGEVF